MKRYFSRAAPLLLSITWSACSTSTTLDIQPGNPEAGRSSDAATAMDSATAIDAASDAVAEAATAPDAAPDADTEAPTDAGADAPSDADTEAATDAAFDAPSDSGPNTPTKCRAGYYTGTFQGDWRPGAFDLGGGLTLVTADIEANGTDEPPGLSLTLVESLADAQTPGVYAVKNGCVTGTATASGLEPRPFVATLSGSLDCATGDFVGTVQGKYSLFDAGETSVWAFSGPFTASFNAKTSTLDEGEWDLREQQVGPDEDPGAGGEGTWDATWQSKDAPAWPAECEALANGMFDADAGVP